MDDLPRLLDDPAASPLGRTLLSSARSDAPSPDARARAARRLGVAAVLAATSAGSEAGAVAAGWKAAALVLALSSVVGVAIWQIAPRIASEPAPATHATQRGQGGPSAIAMPVEPPPMIAPAPAPTSAPATTPTSAPTITPAPAPTSAPTTTPAPTALPAAPHARPHSTTHIAPAAPAPAAPPSAPAPHIAPAAPAAPAPAAPPALAVEPAPESSAPTPARAAPPLPAVPVTSTASRLAAEVALVDRARSRLAASDPRGALAALARYHQQFVAGDLAAEADAVAIEAWIALGDPARARALADAFLSQFPRSPLAQRVHSLIARLPVTP